MTRPIRLLMLEDNANDAELAIHELQRTGFEPDWVRVDTEQEFVQRLEPDLDLIIADFQLPQFNGLEALHHVRKRNLDVPVIIVSGTIGEEMAVRLIKEGAADYLLKDRLARLGVAVGQALDAHRQRLEKRRAEQAILRMNRIRAVLSGINATIVRVRDRNQLLAQGCEIVRTRGEFEHVWIGLCEPSGADLYWIDPEGSDVPDAAPPSPIKQLATLALDRGRPVFRSDHEDGEEEHSVAVLPMEHLDKWIGVLGLSAQRDLDNEELSMLLEVAADLAFALDYIDKASRLDYLAYYDPVTGFPNRRLLSERLEQAMQMSIEKSASAVAVVGFDQLSSMIETFGQSVVDDLCRSIAKRLEYTLGTRNVLAHFGAGVFAVMFPGQIAGASLGHAIEASIMDPLSEPFELHGKELRLSVRVGIAVAPGDGLEAEILLHNAEAALIKCRDSQEHYSFYSQEIHQRMSRKLNLENRLRVALEKDQFVLFYQPKVDSKTGELTGVEALLRWEDPDRGLVAPGEFIPLLEETGLIVEVGNWVISRAVADYRDWRAKGIRIPMVAVNVSPRQLRDKRFVDLIGQAVEEVGEGHLELEITESVLMEDTEGSIKTLGILRELGAKVAIDDFGTGYSSLSYLSRMPVTALKIDQSFVFSMTKGPNDLAIVTSIISLAHSMNLMVIAEGVETEEQARLLRLLRCDQMQGYLYGRPNRSVPLPSR
ncbi:putative bifunctional diguanylate cyclase/phosphodiesterase [Marinobacter lipolyticus]|uniref:putative bifunctional diguanylate cyclase/phosphodiesterase n=1 Tax=Marinobacter lipolyticus TaxID=209639 RepID=UPI003A93F9E6